MKRFVLVLALAGVTGAGSMAAAQTPPAPAPDCAAQATEKKLAGAALNSFMKKCERDQALRSCEDAATEKKLSGAARKSFTKKCVTDATLTPAAQ